MRIMISGGSGFIGRSLVVALLKAKHHVTVLSRNPMKVRSYLQSANIEIRDAKSELELAQIISGSDAVINLAGEAIASGRWTSKQKEKILLSRVESTRAIVNAIERAQNRPAVLLNASAVGYYGNVPENEVVEDYPKGKGFLSDVCGQWEKEAIKVQEYKIRVVLLRSGIVLDKFGGSLQKLLVPFRFFIGGPLGDGKQWLPWIHLTDEIEAIIFAMENRKIIGPVNLAAPETIRMNEFCRTLGSVLNRPSRLRIPKFVLKAMLGEMSEIVLQGQKVFPKKLIDNGYKFRFPDLENALRDLLT